MSNQYLYQVNPFCPNCGTEFEANVGVNHVDRVGFSHPDYISNGTKPV